MNALMNLSLFGIINCSLSKIIIYILNLKMYKPDQFYFQQPF